MPLGPFEREVLRLIAGQRNPESYVAGATVLNQAPASPRTSEDIDVFHDSEIALAAAHALDLAALRAHGFAVQVPMQTASFCRAIVARAGLSTKIEWALDSVFRFFPTEPDAELGWRLNFWDAATNKMLAFVGRRVPRDFVDVLHLHDTRLHLGALAWAASGKDPGLSPAFILEQSRRTPLYPPEMLAPSARLAAPGSFPEVRRRWLRVVEEAEALIAALPAQEFGCLYLNAIGQPVTPDPAAPDFAGLTRHYGSIRGAVPRIVEE